MSLSPPLDNRLNPYAPPEADDEPASAAEPGELEAAGPGVRLAAAVLDNALLLLSVLLVLAIVKTFTDESDTDLLAGLALVAVAPVGLVQLWMLSTRGQSFGKWLMNIRIVRIDGREGGWWTFGVVRGWSVFLAASLINFIVPLKLGGLLMIIDVLGVFTRERRCLHDEFAKTRVVMVR